MIGSNIEAAADLDAWFRENVADVYTPLSPGHGPLSNDRERYRAAPAAAVSIVTVDYLTDFEGTNRWFAIAVVGLTAWFAAKGYVTEPTGEDA